MAEGGEDIEMGNRGREEERRKEEEKEKKEEENTAETSFINKNQRERLDDLTRPHMNNPPMTRVEDEVPNTGRDSGSMKGAITRDKKLIFLEELGVKVNKKDGMASKNLVEWTTFTFNKKTDRVDGASFDGARVLVSTKGGGIRYSENKSPKVVKAIERFKALSEEARTEHSNTTEGLVEEISNDPTISEEAMDDTLSQVSSAISDWADKIEEELQDQARRGLFMTDQEVREFVGTLNPQGTSAEKIKALEIQANYYRVEAMTKTNPLEEEFYKAASKAAELMADKVRFETGERPEHAEAISIVRGIVENNDLGRLERFKRWAKNNMVGLSAVAISVAAIITTIIIAARKAVLGGARAVGSFAKAVANLAKKLGPLLAPLFNLLAQALVWGAKGIGWLASNLWVLAVVIAWVMYDYWKNRKSGK